MCEIFKFENFELTSFEDESNQSKTDYSFEQNDIIKNFELDFDFIKLGLNITPFYLFTESLLGNLEVDDMNDSKESIVYITICSLAILFEEPKDSYKKLFEELRLRGIYGALKPIVNTIKELKPTLDDLAELNGRELNDFKDLFEYIELFEPFMIALSTVIKENNIKPESLEVTSEFSDSIVLILKKLDLNGDFKKTIDNIEVIDNGNDIKKYGQFKDDLEMINDDKIINLK